MLLFSKKSTPRRITPTPVLNTSKSPSSPFPSGKTFAAQTSPVSLEEERHFLKLMRNKKNNKADSPWGSKSPPLPVLGDFISSPSTRPISNTKISPVEKDVPDNDSNGEESQKKNVQIVYLPAERGKVTFTDKIIVLGKVYSACIRGLTGVHLFPFPL